MRSYGRNGALRATLVFLLFGVASAQAPYELVREEQRIVVDGVQETWRLVWTAPPNEECGPGNELYYTCPCAGFAFGEGGPASLVGVRGGVEVDRLALGPLFGEDSPRRQGIAVIPKFPYKWQTDSGERHVKREAIERRPRVKVMKFGDYNHDGRATEFYLQTSAIACGWQFGVVIGVSRNNSRLHALSANNSATPLYLRYPLWERIREARSPLELSECQCGDHGAENETRVSLAWADGALTGTRRTYTCPPDPRRLLSEKPLGGGR